MEKIALGKDFVDKVKDFVHSPNYTRTWIYDPLVSVYFRIAFHEAEFNMIGHMPCSIRQTLDVADIQFNDESLYWQIFTDVLDLIEPLADLAKLTVYFENPTDDRLDGVLIRRGYTILNPFRFTAGFHYARIIDAT